MAINCHLLGINDLINRESLIIAELYKQYCGTVKLNYTYFPVDDKKVLVLRVAVV